MNEDVSILVAEDNNVLRKSMHTCFMCTKEPLCPHQKVIEAGSSSRQPLFQGKCT